jgi:hypothetical protein
LLLWSRPAHGQETASATGESHGWNLAGRISTLSGLLSRLLAWSRCFDYWSSWSFLSYFSKMPYTGVGSE